MANESTSPSFASVEDPSHRVAEVVAMYGRSVVDVAHVGQSRSRKASALPLLGLGGALMIGGLALFGYEVAQPWQEYSAARIAAEQAHAEAPAAPGLGTGGLGLGLALLGLVPLIAGGLRLRDESLEVYTIGESPSASFKLSGVGLPNPDATPLVERHADGYAIAFGSGTRGSVEIGERRFGLGELAETSRFESRGDGLHRLPLPAGARARIEHGDITFQISSVARGAIVAGRGEVDWPLWAHVGGTTAIGLSFYLLMRATPDTALGLDLADQDAEARFARYLHQADEVDAVEPEERPASEVTESNGGDPGERASGEEGQAGKPTSKKRDGAFAIKSRPNHSPQLARNYDPVAQARNAGILGLIAQQEGHFFAHASGGAFAVGQDDMDIWGNVVGTSQAEAYGVGGLGLVGTGRFGGGANGLIGMGNTGLIGHGPGTGDGPSYGPKDGNTVGFKKHQSKNPDVVVGQAGGVGFDRDLVRRIVRAHINEVRGCYNAGLTNNPSLEGRVVIKFTIMPTGKVSSTIVDENSTKSTKVADCIAKAVKRWSFPKVSKGTAIVTYPFRLSAG